VCTEVWERERGVRRERSSGGEGREVFTNKDELTNYKVWLVKSEISTCVTLVCTHALMDGRGMIMFTDKLVQFLSLCNTGMNKRELEKGKGKQEKGRKQERKDKKKLVKLVT
jgi:hypothetical protein